MSFFRIYNNTFSNDEDMKFFDNRFKTILEYSDEAKEQCVKSVQLSDSMRSKGKNRRQVSYIGALVVLKSPI